MKKTFLAILAVMMFSQSCHEMGNDQTLGQIPIHFNRDSSSTPFIESMEIASCECEGILWKPELYSDLSFSNNGTPFRLDSLTRWVNNPDRLNVHSLRLIDFDTIPSEMAIFENVETLFLESINHKNLQGLENFPKLIRIQVEGERFEWNEGTKWIKKLESIHANKTQFSGIKSFDQMPNLRDVKLSFSGFDRFPINMDKLFCLSYFQSSAHTFGEIDLDQIDLTKLPCIKHIEFQSWRENLKGVPLGIGSMKSFKISHPNLTHSEREQLKKAGDE